MSDGPGIPRLLASILGVEQPGVARSSAAPPQGPVRRPASQSPAPVLAREAAPPSAAGSAPRLTPPERLVPPARGARAPVRAVFGRPPAATQATPASTDPVRRPRPVHDDVGAAYVLPAAGDARMTRAALRVVLRSPAHARTAVLAAEVLGAPRSLRPFGEE